MTTHGVCLDGLNPDASPSADRLPPFEVARMVAFDDAEWYAYHWHLHTAGLATVAVLASETFGGSTDPSVWAATCDSLARNCWPDLWVIGNEPDAWLLPVESPASWTMLPARYAELWTACEQPIRARQPDARLVVGGMVSGQPYILAEYVKAIRDAGGGPIHGADIHPYSRGAESAEELLTAYRAVLESL